MTKKEIIIVVKTELLPALKDRVKNLADKTLFDKKLQEHRTNNEDIKKKSPNQQEMKGEDPEKEK